MVILSRDGRHCDERCYNARWAGCRCVCGGKNHGRGLERAMRSSGRDLSVYGDTVGEQAEGLRHELEHERREAMSVTFMGNFGGRSFDELVTDEMRKDALMDVDGAFEVHGTRSGRLDSTRPNRSTTPGNFYGNSGERTFDELEAEELLQRDTAKYFSKEAKHENA